MTLREFDHHLKEVLPFAQYDKEDMGLNGLQVGNLDKEIKHIAFALDACEASIRQAIREKADLLVVHHGLFWGKPVAVTASHYHRVKLLLDNNIALYAIHLPLDATENFGNNSAVANLCGLQNMRRFEGLGFSGNFEEPLDVFDLARRVFPHKNVLVWPFQPKVSRVAVLVGGAARYAYKAKEQGFNCFITGEMIHELYHFCEEEGLSIIAGGHYESEFIGLKTFATWVEQNYKPIKITLIDLPTGL